MDSTPPLPPCKALNRESATLHLRAVTPHHLRDEWSEGHCRTLAQPSVTLVPLLPKPGNGSLTGGEDAAA